MSDDRRPTRRRRRRPAQLVAACSVGMLCVLVVGCSDDSRSAGSPSTTEPDGTSTAEHATDTTPTVTTGAAEELLEGACRGELSVVTAGTLPDHLTSVSGLAASRRHPGVLWAIEDSLEPAVLTAIDLEGRELAAIRVTGRLLMNLDWEDVAIGPGPDGEPWIHVADIGDNLGIRPEVRILRFPEPDLDATEVEADVIDAGYDSGRPNAEALIVDTDGGIWVIDKTPDSPATVYELDGTTLRPRTTLDLAPEQVTAADLSPDGAVLAVRTVQSVRLHRVEEGDVLGALEQEPCLAPAPDERQGESLAFTATGEQLVTVSEDESRAPVDLHVIGR